MTIRNTITQLLSGDETGTAQPNPAEALAESGFGDVPADLFGTALTHFSDTAPLPQADALAPIVTRAGPVPFESGDLADLPEGSDVGDGDVFSLFEAVAPQAVPTEDDQDDYEGYEQDVTLDDEAYEADSATQPDSVSQPEETSEPDETSEAEADQSFGRGSEADTAEEALTDPEAGFDDAIDLDELAPRFDAGSAYENDGLGGFETPIEDESTDLFSVEFDESDQTDDGLDPNDLDFEGE